MGILDNAKHELAASYLRSVLSYNPETGVFHWLQSLSPRIRVGDRAGSPGGHGYIQIQIKGRLYLAHVLAWVYTTGQWPTTQIDHKDTKRSNNAWLNLRSASPHQNCANQGPRKTNKAGVKGLHYDASINRWRGSVTAKGKRTTISAKTREEALAGLLDLQRQLHGDFARTAA